ncbi:B-box-type zinc finger [Tanacetum coccineum]
MKKCELCNHAAEIYCSSDTASLCYTCDQKVHSANFLVAKHSRTLLCHKCHSQTPWTASGLHLGRTVTVCVNCVGDDVSSHRQNDVVEEDIDEDVESSDSDDESESEDEDAQVVPWGSDDVAPPCASGGCSTSESSDFRSGVKRRRFDDECDRIDSEYGMNSYSGSPDDRELVFIDVHGRELVVYKLQDFLVPDFYASSSAVFLHLPWILLCLSSNPS